MRPKILMVLDHEFPPDERVEKEIATLIELGCKVSIACLTMSNKTQFEVRESGLTIYRRQISSLMHNTHVGCLKFPFYFNWWRSFLKNIMVDEAFDFLHIHDLPLAKVGLELKNEFNLKVVVDTHENWPSSVKHAKHTNTVLGKFLSPYDLWVKYEKEVLPQVDKVITVIKEMKDRLINVGVSPEKIEILPNTIDTSRFKVNQEKREMNPKAPILFYGGGVNIHRGVQVVIKSLVLLKEELPDLKFWVIGGGSYVANCKQIANELDVSHMVYFSGGVSQKDLWSKMLESDICLIPHLKIEQTDCSSPNKIYQYMWASKPIITSNCNSLERIVKETNTGLSYQYDNPSDLADKILKLVKSSGDMRLFSANGPKSIKENLNWQNCASEVLRQVYFN